MIEKKNAFVILNKDFGLTDAVGLDATSFGKSVTHGARSCKSQKIIEAIYLKIKMPLLYAVVARQNVVLARFSLTVGNFAEVTELILSRIVIIN